MEEQYILNEDFQIFLDYIDAHINIAFEGKTNGHNFNSYFPRALKDKIPYHLYDIVWMAISQIAENYKSMSKDDIKFYYQIKDNGYNWKWSQTGYGAYKNGVAFLLKSLKIVELYLNK